MSEPTVVGTHIHVGYEPSETEQALVQRVHELEGKLTKAIAENVITCCACGRPARLRGEAEKRNADLEQQLLAANERIAEFESWVRAAKQFEWSHPKTCPSHFSARGQCVCGLDQFLYRPDLFIETYESQLKEARQKIAELQSDKKAAEINAQAAWIVIEEMQRRNASR